jgi:2-polyprenyl-3-methyl-5-hydroxy-6-metoxy-1,4-benzoquinol methylase
MKTPDTAALQAIARLCDRQWDYHYTRIKLATDPVYAAVAAELAGTALPALDVGCGMGLLAHYLRAAGMMSAMTGLDLDERKIRSARAMAERSGQQGLAFEVADAAGVLPPFSGHVVLLDMLQYLTPGQRHHLLTAAADRVAVGGRLIIRSGLQDASWRFRATIAGDWLARITCWMISLPLDYPTADELRTTLEPCGLSVSIRHLWGGTPFNNHLIVGSRQ